jgi:drug/metabolite transporter (DMT)-like permease
MSQQSHNLLKLHGAVLLFGLPGLFGKLLAFSPIAIVFGRVGFAAVALFFASAFWKLPLWPRSGRSCLAFLGLGLLFAAHSTAFFQSVQVSGVAVALIAFSTFPAFVALLEPLIQREIPRVCDVILAGCALGGVAVLLPSLEPNDSTMQGVLWGVASGLLFALLSLFNRQYVRHHSGITLALYQDAFAAVALLPFVLVRWPTLTTRDLMLLIVLGVLCTAVAHTLFITALRGIEARTASMITCLEPVYGSILAALILREMLTARIILGGLLVLGVVLYATFKATNRQAVPEPT